MAGKISTPHIANDAPIAQTILLPGDPLRAKFISEKYLEDVEQFNSIRSMFGYTGTYNGKRVSVMGTGMGIPSIGIYSYELIHFFGVKNLIRVGSCGALADELNLYDVVVAVAASTNSNFASQYQLPGQYAPSASWKLLKACADTADKLGQEIHAGNVLSSDTFYDDDKESAQKWLKMGVLGIEMEAAALYMNAARANAHALGIFTVSDHIIRHEETTAAERQTAFDNMIKLALETAAGLE